jgi:hypothetical protein
MILNGSVKIPSHSIIFLEKDADWFESLLQKHNIAVPPSSPLHEHLSVMRKIPSWLRGEYNFPPEKDLSRLFNIVLGLNYQIKAIARAIQTPSKDTIITRLKEIFYGPNVILSMYVDQNKDRDRAWELLVGCLVALISDDLSFNSPDVRCLFEGVNWGIECKFLYSNKRNWQANKIVEGVKQLEISPAELGCVIVNVSNLIDHSKYLSQKPDINIKLRHLMTLLFLKTCLKLILKASFVISKSLTLSTVLLAIEKQV